MKNRTINTFGLKYISEEVFAKIQSYTIGKNDLYVTIAGTIGVVGEVPEILDGMNLTENAVKVCNISINKTFLCYVMLSELVQQQFQDKTHQVAMPKLALERILGTLIPVCPVKEQQLIVFSIKSALQISDTIEIQKDTLFELVSATKSKILDLAIRGKLVPQDPNDEPASVLLERIRAEKEELIKQGKIKRDKKESVIFKGEDNSYYIQTGSLIEELGDWSLNCLPDSWGICCLGEVCDYGSCVNVGTDCIEDDAWILDLKDIEKDTGRVIKKVKKSERSAMSTKHSFKKGQVLYSKLRPYLNKVVLADEDGYCTSEILPLDFNSLVLPAYARYYLMTPAFLAYANRCSYGVKMPRLSTSAGKKAVMTIPPLAEQKRIVAAIETYYSKLDKIAEMLT